MSLVPVDQKVGIRCTCLNLATERAKVDLGVDVVATAQKYYDFIMKEDSNEKAGNL